MYRLREGCSLPALIKADYERLDVRKFRGEAGRDRKALVAELIVGELAPTDALQDPDIA